MLAGILPGLREIRAPLAAGYLWLLFGWLILSDDAATAGGVVGRLVDLGGVLTDAALAVAASFAAYLIGSLSEDLFRWQLVRVVRGVVLRRQEREQERSFQAERWGVPDAVPDAAPNPRRRMLEELGPQAIESEITKLENQTSRLDAESSLRIAILPPLAAIYVYLVLDSWWWIFAGVFLPLLLAQAFLRTRDYQVASHSLYELRRLIGLPPWSAREEASATEKGSASASGTTRGRSTTSSGA